MRPADLHSALTHQAHYSAIPMRFKVEMRAEDEVEVSLFLTTRDPLTGEPIEQRTSTRHYAPALAAMEEETVIDWLWHTLIKTAWLHEAGEAFMWSGRRPKNPHTKEVTP